MFCDHVTAEVVGSNLFISKTLGILCHNNIITSRGNWPQTSATPYHSQLRLPDKGRAIKGLVVCNVVWLGSMGWVFGLAFAN